MIHTYPRMAHFLTVQELQAHLDTLGIDLPLDEVVPPAPDGPLAQPFRLPDGKLIGNRFCIQPMEGWDGTAEGLPSEKTERRWLNFARSGAKLIWGCEAAAVRPDGRANPNQLVIQEHSLAALENLRQKLVKTHQEQHGASHDLLVGLQLTHSGRFSRPNGKKLEPKILYHHPLLESIYPLDPAHPVLSDGEIETLIADYVRAARQAQQIGFDFVDVKHCHGYLGHEFLSARSRPGPYGGSFANRTRFLREIVSGIRSAAPGLRIGVRLSAFDLIPFRPGPDGVGQPLAFRDENGQYPYAFGADADDPTRIDLGETIAFLEVLQELEITLVNITGGSPYYNPHIQRPALFPPSDGYLPPEDPLVGVARHILVTARLKERFPGLAMVGTAYTYLQEWLPNAAQGVLRRGMADFIGLGRMVLAYPELPADVLAGRPLQRKRLCRTFSDCTTAPRHGLVSGCFPLDGYYRSLPEAASLAEIKKK